MGALHNGFYPRTWNTPSTVDRAEAFRRFGRALVWQTRFGTLDKTNQSILRLVVPHLIRDLVTCATRYQLIADYPVRLIVLRARSKRATTAVFTIEQQESDALNVNRTGRAHAQDPHA